MHRQPTLWVYVTLLSLQYLVWPIHKHIWPTKWRTVKAMHRPQTTYIVSVRNTPVIAILILVPIITTCKYILNMNTEAGTTMIYVYIIVQSGR